MQEQLGHYRILEPIGSGGMGRVFRARDQQLERNVALKVLPEAVLGDDTVRRRFRREALALSRVNHPNIATIHAFDTIDGVDVLVMEHIPGASLDELLRNGPLPEPEVVRLGRQLAEALSAAHERNVIHRDLKPGNVRVTPEGRLKVLDFGLARALEADAEARTDSVTGPFMAGTLPYMAPEQVRGDAVDQRTDIYGAGAVLYEMATGARVHGALGGTPLIAAILDAAPKAPAAVNPGISPELNRIITKALDKNPDRRYQSARELAIDLERLGAPAEPPPGPRSRRRAVSVAAAVALVLALTGWVAYRGWSRTPISQDPKSIVIADFENETEDRQLSDAIRAGLTVQLEQSPHVSVLSREQVFDALRRMQRVDRPPDTATARELALRENVPILLAGRIQRRGGVTRIEARGIDPRTQDVLFVEPVEYRREDEVFHSIDALARSVRRNLGESMTGIDQQADPLAKVTTGSFEALKQYSRAADELARGNADGALPLLQTALRVDPEFAMAHRLVARVYETLGNASKEREHLGRSYELRAKLSDRERLHVEASYFKGRGEYERAVESLTALTTLYPNDGEAHYELALAYRDAGDVDKAVQELETVVSESPYVTVAYGDLVLQLARLSNYERAKAVHAEARKRNVGGPKLEWARAMVLLGEGGLDEARARFRDLERASEVYAGVARLYLAAADILEGRLQAASERLREDVLVDRTSGNLAAEIKRRYLLGQLSQLQGNRADALAQARAMVESRSDRLGPNELRLAGTLLASLNELPRATALLDQLDRMRRDAPSAFLESCYHNLAGEIALATGRPADAVQAFNNATVHYARAVTTRGLARAYAAGQDWPRAVGAWQQVIAARGEFLHEGFVADFVLSYLESARAHRAAGKIDQARDAYDRFLRLWTGAGPLPALEAAEAERRSVDVSGR
jgi:serine/threonine protein kinase/tetratricopeptide (TPR) repeat protein